MLISGSPLAIDMPSDPSFRDRFWYWTGASGRRYIHSVYQLEECPPLPGAIYLAVRRQGSMRVVMEVGRFSPFWDGPLGSRSLTDLRELGADEVHVHLLARSPEVAQAVHDDLSQSFGSDAEQGFMEDRLGSGLSLPVFAGSASAA